MGHWSAKADKSSGVYDGARTATELAYKSNVAENVRAGWRPVPHGNIPQKPLVPLSEAAVSHVSTPSVVPGLAAKAKPKPSMSGSPQEKRGYAMAGDALSLIDQGNWSIVDKEEGGVGAAAGAQHVFPGNVVQVLNERTKMVHLSSGEGVACNAWRCGTAEQPAKGACFAASTTRWSPELNPFAFCRGCYSVRCLGRLGGKLKVNDKELELASSGASSSSGSSSSSSSSSS